MLWTFNEHRGFVCDVSVRLLREQDVVDVVADLVLALHVAGCNHAAIVAYRVMLVGFGGCGQSIAVLSISARVLSTIRCP